MLAFKKNNYDRKSFDLKNVRNDLMHIMGKPIAWEVAVGRTIGKLIKEDNISFTSEDNIFCYLGKVFIEAILNKNVITV